MVSSSGLQRHPILSSPSSESSQRPSVRAEQPRDQQDQQRPLQSHAGATTLHQPVANRVQNSIHGPNGLLSTGGSGSIQSNGPSSTSGVSIFNTAPPPPVTEQRSQFMHQQGPPTSQQAVQSFMAGPSPMPAQAQLPHGQQPILNVCNLSAFCFVANLFRMP